MANSPPANWTDARRLDYVQWARDVVAGARGVNAWLEATFDQAAAVAEAAVNAPAGSATGTA
jgi:hypothetical protein